jgi:hypothetical protein
MPSRGDETTVRAENSLHASSEMLRRTAGNRIGSSWARCSATRLRSTTAGSRQRALSAS